MNVNSRVEILFVIKRDSHLSIFESEKLVQSIFNSISEVQCGDMEVATDISRLVECILLKEHPCARVLSSAIRRTVDLVLRETGLDLAAATYKSFHEQREFVRRQIEVRCNVKQRDLFDSSSKLGEIWVPWEKARLYHSLIKRGFASRAAETLANSVERQVIHSGIRSLSTEFLSSWIENEIVQSQQGLGMFRETGGDQ